MRLGLNVPNFGPTTTPASLRSWIEFAEQSGFSLAVMSDHVAPTPDVTATYPEPFYDPFATLSWLAGFTTRISLGTSVAIVPYRHPLLTARMVANLDHFTGGRFVFGVVNRNANGGCSTTRFTVILEYGVPIRGCTAVRSYGQQWDNLGNLVLGSPAYNAALQAITDQFTSANAAPNKPNRSAINQVRSNENALNPLWELREFVLRQGSPLLQISSTVQTPHHSWNNSGLLANYINTNAAALVAGTNVIPPMWAGQPFLTGSNFNFGVGNAQVWNAPGVANQPRHMLSLNTCNACHGGEARDSTVPADLPFLHVGVRLPAGTSPLSKFLLGNGTLAAPSTFNKPDPINGAPVRQFGDLLRRQQDLSNLVNSSCLSTGLINQLQFQPLQMVH
jgi:hypothetical protein